MEINHSSKCRPVLLWKQQLDAVSARSSLPITRIFTAVTSSSYLKVWISTASRRVDFIKQQRKSYLKTTLYSLGGSYNISCFQCHLHAIAWSTDHPLLERQCCGFALLLSVCLHKQMRIDNHLINQKSYHSVIHLQERDINVSKYIAKFLSNRREALPWGLEVNFIVKQLSNPTKSRELHQFTEQTKLY